jgi:hypothetical protein
LERLDIYTEGRHDQFTFVDAGFQESALLKAGKNEDSVGQPNFVIEEGAALSRMKAQRVCVVRNAYSLLTKDCIGEGMMGNRIIQARGQPQTLGSSQ